MTLSTKRQKTSSFKISRLNGENGNAGVKREAKKEDKKIVRKGLDGTLVLRVKNA